MAIANLDFHAGGVIQELDKVGSKPKLLAAFVKHDAQCKVICGFSNNFDTSNRGSCLTVNVTPQSR